MRMIDAKRGRPITSGRADATVAGPPETAPNRGIDRLAVVDQMAVDEVAPGPGVKLLNLRSIVLVLD